MKNLSIKIPVGYSPGFNVSKLETEDTLGTLVKVGGLGVKFYPDICFSIYIPVWLGQNLFLKNFFLRVMEKGLLTFWSLKNAHGHFGPQVFNCTILVPNI